MFPVEANLQLLLRQVNDATERWRLSHPEISEWNARRREQTEWWDWFTGKALEVLDRSRGARKDGTYPLKYPLQINPFGIAARFHSYVLWGAVPDTSGLLVQTMVETRKDESKDLAKTVESVLEDIDYENNARAMDLEMGLAIQSLGGIVLKVGWDPTDILLPTGIRYEYFDPRVCHFRWRGNNFWNLTDAWVVMSVSAETARMYGVDLGPGIQQGVYMEYWNTTEYRISINDQIARAEDGTPLAGDHKWGFVPFIYLPHERHLGSFYGNSIVQGLVGMVTELNAREADMGDAIRYGIDSVMYGRNIRSGPSRKTLANGQEWYDLGSNNLSGKDSPPELIRVDAPKLPEGANDFISRLHENIRTMLYTPDVTYGKDQGSQRSGNTERARSWSLLGHVSAERSLWTVARNLRAEMALRILADKGTSDIGANHLGLRKVQNWAEMMPLDRAQLVDELIRRKQENAISAKLLIDKFGDAPDKEEELKRLEEQEQTAIEMQQKKFANSAQGNGVGSKTEQAGENKQPKGGSDNNSWQG